MGTEETAFIGSSDVEHTPGAVVGRVARLGLWNVVGFLAASISALAINVVVGRKLGPALFGRYSYFVWIVRTTFALGAFGIPAATNRLVSEFQGAGDTDLSRGIFRSALRLQLLLSPAVLGGTAIWVWTESEDVLLAGGLGLASVLLSFSLIFEQSVGGLRRFAVVARNAVAVAGFHLVVLGYISFSRPNLRLFLLLYVVYAVVSASVWGISTHTLFRKWRLKTPPASEKRRLFRLSFVMAIIALSDTVLWGRPELFFLERFWSRREVGLYSAALTLMVLTSYLPMIASRVLTPEFAWLRGGGKHEALSRSFPLVSTVVALVAIPLGIGGAIVARDMLIIAYGVSFADAAPAASILMVGSIFAAIAGPASSAAVTGPRPGFVARVATVMAIANIALDIWLISQHAVIGAAIANMTAQAATIIVVMLYVRRNMGLSYPIGALFKILLASLIAAGAARFLTGSLPGHLPLLAAIPLAVILYAALVRLLGVITWHQLMGILRSRGQVTSP